MGIFSRFGSRRSGDKPDRLLGAWAIPAGHHGDPKIDEMKAAAAADVAAMEAEDRNFSPDAPGSQEDDLYVDSPVRRSAALAPMTDLHRQSEEENEVDEREGDRGAEVDRVAVQLGADDDQSQ